MKYLITIIMLAASWMVQAQIVISHQAKLSFFSEAPVENIKAESKSGLSALNLSTKTIYFKVPMRSFEFRKSLMQEHFNENYMESSKYPFAEFNGKIKEQIDLTKDGIYPVTVQGDLNIHGVLKNYMVKAELNVKGGIISANSTFPVKLADHKIEIPRLVIMNIAEVVQVTVSAQYTPDSKETLQSSTSPK
jgi:polyisoprenoid-binding protein YceI